MLGNDGCRESRKREIKEKREVRKGGSGNSKRYSFWRQLRDKNELTNPARLHPDTDNMQGHVVGCRPAILGPIFRSPLIMARPEAGL